MKPTIISRRRNEVFLLIEFKYSFGMSKRLKLCSIRWGAEELEADRSLWIASKLHLHLRNIASYLAFMFPHLMNCRFTLEFLFMLENLELS